MKYNHLPTRKPGSLFRFLPVNFISAAASIAVLLASDAMGHGMAGHSHSHSRDENVSPAVVNADGSEALTEYSMEERRERLWGVNLNTFWESKHIHYGITEADGKSVMGAELGIEIENFSFGASGIFGLGTNFQEWNFSAAYTVEAGPVFITPGFNFRYNPSGHGHEEDSHEEHHDEHGEEHGDHEEEHGDHDDHGHEHREYGYELFVVVGTTAIPYVVPSVGFLWDLAQGSGGFMEMRLDGDIPLYKDIVTLAPYTSLGLNFGYNTQEYYGWNNFMYGVNLNVSLTRNITVYAGVGQNVAFQAARDAGTSNEVFVNTGISLNF